MTSTFDGRRHFYSDNLAGTHPDVLHAMAAANVGHALAYGEDPLTQSAQARVCDLFGGDEVEAFFVFNGTAANVLSAAAVTAPFQAVVCSDTSPFDSLGYLVHHHLGSSILCARARVHLTAMFPPKGTLTTQATVVRW